MRSIAGSAGLALALLAAPACLISTSGLAGGPTAEPSPDAAAEAGPLLEDAGPSDGGAGLDAAGPFCASLSPKPAFCQDFDESADIDDGWTGALGIPRGKQAIDGATWTSGSQSLATSLPAGKSTGYEATTIGAGLQQITNQQADDVIVDFDLRVEAANTVGAEVVSLLFGGDSPYAVHFIVAENDLTLQEDLHPSNQPASYPHESLGQALALNTWTHVRMEVSFPQQQISVTVGSAAAFVQPMADGAQNGTLVLQVGAIYFSDGATLTPTSLHHDNVVLRMQ